VTEAASNNFLNWKNNYQIFIVLQHWNVAKV